MDSSAVQKMKDVADFIEPFRKLWSFIFIVRLKQIPQYAPVVRFVAVSAIVLSGLWMWKGHAFSMAYFANRKEMIQGVVCGLTMVKRADEGRQPLTSIWALPGAPTVCRKAATPTTAPDSLSTGPPLEPSAKSAVMQNMVTFAA
jgi:hypothetical protein